MIYNYIFGKESNMESALYIRVIYGEPNAPDYEISRGRLVKHDKDGLRCELDQEPYEVIGEFVEADTNVLDCLSKAMELSSNYELIRWGRLPENIGGKK